MKNVIKLFFSIFLCSIFLTNAHSTGEKVDLLKTDWSFKGYLGKFDRGSLNEVTKSTQKFVLHVIQ